MLIGENVLKLEEKNMGDDNSDICFECLGEAAWCPVCKKDIVPREEGSTSAEQAAGQESDPNQLPLL